ncbi:MAG: hypothetical protein OIN84_00180 [Candidatus Methanoperedens sp.]|jgi:hypothetical protein|nr:hypothetical protein [Candidatus Methanoperedens sp.]
MVNEATIYIRLLDEGVETWRPTTAEEVRPGVFMILPSTSFDPETETWEFTPGQLVECELQEKLNRGHPEKVLVALNLFNS